jgi:hypothetical protein
MLALGLAMLLGLAKPLVRSLLSIPAACLALNGLQAAVAAHSITQKIMALRRPRIYDAADPSCQAAS